MESLTTRKARYDRAVAHLPAPLAIIDVPAYRGNAAQLVRRAAGLTIRLATKSLRVRAIIEEVSRSAGFSGLLGYSLPEALFLVARGTSDDIVVAYPTTDRAAIAELAQDHRAAACVTLMVDSVGHLDLICDAVAGLRGVAPVRVAIDVDASLELAGGRIHIGARRSPVHSAAPAVALAAQIVRRPQLHLDGLMSYEAQIAGVGDRPRGSPIRGAAVQAMQRRSAAELAVRRAEVVAAIRDVAPLRFVNGGGTGSIEMTVADPAVTEVAAGSGVLAPHLFDNYSSFRLQPAALFALPVVRRPAPGWVTAFSGGYLASGPADSLRLPQVVLPPGLRLSGTEGAGEVQTPLHGAAADGLALGELVWLRHAKAGELAERFTAYHLVQGEGVVDTVPTYRGEGQSFG